MSKITAIDSVERTKQPMTGDRGGVSDVHRRELPYTFVSSPTYKGKKNDSWNESTTGSTSYLCIFLVRHSVILP